MKERPILFSAPMVRALLAGTKTQTRRAMNPQPVPWGKHGGWELPGYCASTDESFRHGAPIFKPKFGQPGDRLWVREAWTEHGAGGCMYAASWTAHAVIGHPKWRPSIHMPRAASRITLEVTAVRVERLQDISTGDCWAEGIASSPDVDPVHEYRDLWESINGPGSWDANPWVWVVEFRRLP